ncbi:MAG: PmoA family protein [Opitutales bacterium]
MDGLERTRWHFGPKYERPFFFPFNGPSGASLTRMGHPGAQNHDHHRSLWFAHADVGGFNFWSNQSKSRIRQKNWLVFDDGEEEAIMASSLGWFDDQDRELMEQELVAGLKPLKDGEHLFELQATFRPKEERLTLGKTNFGFLAVRVAKSIASYWGGGELTNSEGLRGEKMIFGQAARWMDYSGPVPEGQGVARKTVKEGMTYFDHSSTPRHPVHWHVREDGWMGSSFCMLESYVIEREQPLVLRYLLHAHSGDVLQSRADALHETFVKSKGFRVFKSKKPHRQFEVERLG